MIHKLDVKEDVMFLADPALEGRVPGSEGSRIAREYIINTFQRHGLKPLFDDKRSFTQEFGCMSGHGRALVDGERARGANVGAIVEGNLPGYVLVGAHYDHLPNSPGADDNAAAVAQLLAVARHFAQRAPVVGRGLLFLAFDCEEPPNFLQPSMGSVYFTEHCPVPLDEIQVAIVLDLTGHRVPKPRLEDFVFAIGMEHAPAAIEAVLEASRGVRGIHVFPTSNDRVGDMSDHHAFRIRGRPFVFLSCGRTEHYHSSTDTIEHLDLPKAGAIAAFLAGLVAACADGREFVFDPGRGRKAMKEAEAAALSGLLGRPVGVADVDVLVGELSRGL
ncbi:MAG: M28 family peptidase [Candidatus Lokiarchaeota archaeon]|nr:M28 family peptidase [Candidatus Lokiarchaeota archaeon]